MKVRFKKLSPDAVIPRYAHDTDAGLDLTATSLEFDDDGTVTYGTGLAMEIPQGYVGLIFPRSSISRREIALTKKQQYYKNHMATVHRYFSDPDHPYWVCFDSQTTRSKRMEKNAVAMGLEIVEGED